MIDEPNPSEEDVLAILREFVDGDTARRFYAIGTQHAEAQEVVRMLTLVLEKDLNRPPDPTILREGLRILAGALIRQRVWYDQLLGTLIEDVSRLKIAIFPDDLPDA